MRIGSVQFVGLLVLIALGTAAGGILLDSRPLLWCAIVVGAYAIHLLAIHEARKSAEQGYPAAAARSEQSTLDYERMEAERLREELEKKLSQAEEQWMLLRSMVQERLRRSGASDSDGPRPDVEAVSVHRKQPTRTTKLTPASEEPGGAYGRW